MGKRNDDKKLGHIRVRSECSICGSVLFPSERIVALLGNNNSTACEFHTDVSLFPDHGYDIQRVNDRNLCRYPNCATCATSPEATSMHSECFAIFIRDLAPENALDLLWIATAWRNPWRGAPDLQLQDTTNITLSILPAEKHCIPQLRLLPLELIQAIQRYSERYILGLDLAYQLSTSISNELISIPLYDISAWQRGGLPIVAGAQTGHIIRLTVDHRGIMKIEKLKKYPSYSSSRFDNMAFVLQEESYFSGVIGWFKYGLLRLELPKTILGLQIWDTATPPDLKNCTFCPADITPSTRFRTIDMCKTIGVTFFFSHSEAYAIHAHTPTMPCAKTTWERLSSRRRKVVAWVYIPIPPSDNVMAFGIQLEQSNGHFITEEPHFLFRTRLAGDISIGPYHSGDTRDFVLSKLPPTTLIFNEADSQPISVIGAYSKERYESGQIAPFCHATVDELLFDEPSFGDAYLSSAPLESITRVQIFYTEENAYCKGLLFEYENGAQQALGQCRIGVDPYKTCLKPSSFCFIHELRFRPRTEVGLQAVRVEFTRESEHNHDKDSWACFSMNGILRFWFTDEQSQLSVATIPSRPNY